MSTSDPGRTAYEARFAGESRITPWADLPEQARAVWRRVEAACTPDTHPPSPDPRTEMARLSADEAMHRIWQQWFSFYEAHFRGQDVAISMADRMAFYEIAQPILRELAGRLVPARLATPPEQILAELEQELGVKGVADVFRASLFLAKQARASITEPETWGKGAALPEPAVDWRLVPVEPTEEMVVAGDLDGSDVFPSEIYRAMLAAAPKLPGPAQDVEDLREEVAYWRRDLSARLWFLTGEYAAAVRERRWQDAANISTKLNPALASYRSAQDREWHSRCEACGEFVRPDEPSVCNDDVSGHARCLSEDRQDDIAQADTSEEDLARRVADAEAALAEEWPADTLSPVPAPTPAPAEGAQSGLTDTQRKGLATALDLLGEYWSDWTPEDGRTWRPAAIPAVDALRELLDRQSPPRGSEG